MRWILTLLAVLLWPATSLGEESVELQSGAEIFFDRFAGEGNQRILLFPADDAFLEHELAFARALAEQGFEVIYPNLHASYFINAGAFSLSAVPISDLAEFVARIDTPERRLFLVANQRVSVTALETALQYQRASPGQVPGGLLLLSPYLEAYAPGPGEGLDFHPVTAFSNLPIYILQPGSSSRYFYLKDTMAALEKGGSQVFAQVLENTRDAYHIWPGEIEPNEIEERARLPGRIRQAVGLLDSVSAAPLRAEPNYQARRRGSQLHALPQPIADMPAAPRLEFADLTGRVWGAPDLNGRVLLLNFWATWCPPCVQELPALQRLHDKMSGADFSVVSIDVGEDAATIEQFLRSNGIVLDYPILLDTQGDTVRSWQITGFPTSFLVDRQSRLRYGLIGAIEWDHADVIAIIRAMLAEQAISNAVE